MSANNPLRSRLLLEDYMSMLRGLVKLAWAALALALIAQLTIRASSSYPWPDWGDFSFVYNAVMVEFGLNTLALTGLLFYPDWYERIPRESAQRVRWLLIAVILWLSIHLFAVFHATGGLGGPFLLLLPGLVIVTLAAFPGKVGWYLVAYLLVGHLLVLVFEKTGFITQQGMLSEHFKLADPISPWAASALLCVVAITVVMALALRKWMLNPLQRIDPGSGLFRRSFLEHRVDLELERINRQGGSAALLLISLDSERSSDTIDDLAEDFIRQLRLGSDTPALYEPGVMAVLLPTAGPDVIKGTITRIMDGLERASGARSKLRVAAAVATSGQVASGKLRTMAEDALSQAQIGGEPVIATA